MNVSDICDICNAELAGDISDIIALDISNAINNNISIIPHFCFQGTRCKTLRKLLMSSNSITGFDDNALSNITELKMLDLNNNSLTINGTFVSPQVFTNLPNLEILLLQANTPEETRPGVTYLSNISPRSLPNLKELKLDGTELMTFGTNFRNYLHLERIDFTGEYARCNMIALNAETFENTPQIRYLNLASCNLSYVDGHTFDTLSNLNYLNISNNEALGFASLRNISYGLQSARKLNVLDYSKVHKQFGLSTELRSCDVWYLENTTIKELYLDNNRLTMIERNALLLFPTTLEVVSADRNMFTFGTYALQIGCLNNLKRVELKYQNTFADPNDYDGEVDIHENKRHNDDTCVVPESKGNRPYCHYFHSDHLNLGDLTLPLNLTTLNVRGWNLPLLPKSPGCTPDTEIIGRLQSIDASYNVLSNLHTPSFKLPRLTHLNISNNFASVIDTTIFYAFPELINLDASNNFLGKPLSEDINGAIFKPLQHLEILNLSSNLITSVPGLSRLNNLIEIHLAFNGITEVPQSLASLKNLTTLDFRQNKISTFPLNLLRQLDETAQSNSRNVSIDLSNNTIEISCENIAFLQWISMHPTYFRHVNTYIYRSNAGIEVVTLRELDKRIMSLNKNCKNYTAIIVISMIFIVGFIFSILAGIVYRYRWRLRYLYYLAKSRYRGYNLIPGEPIEYKYDAFVSYAEDDYLFVKDSVVAELEEIRGLKLCLHQRDFLPGNYIAENILQAIKNSRLIVIVLTDTFLNSKWCIYEYNMARMESIYSRNGENFIVCVMLKEINDKYLSPDLIETLDSETFLKYPQEENEKPYFWEMLNRALSV